VNHNIWDPLHECLERKDLERLQLERLRSTLERVAKVPCYKDKFAASGLSPGDIHSLDDMAKLPFTSKEDLRQNYLSEFIPPQAQRASPLLLDTPVKIWMTGLAWLPVS
jgi:phenylacetate-coenzyme A ligase PaaK-like adenylate-forming protein